MYIIQLCIFIGILLISNSAVANVNTTPNISNVPIKKMMLESAKRWNVDPAFLMAVAHIESRIGNQEFRLGKMGKTFYGPMGIHKYALTEKGWAIYLPKVNIDVGARALRDVGSCEKSQKKRLKRYNASFKESYWKAIQSAKRKYTMEIPHIK